MKRVSGVIAAAAMAVMLACGRTELSAPGGSSLVTSAYLGLPCEVAVMDHSVVDAALVSI